MLDTIKPRIEWVEEKEDYGKLVAEPLERGYGVTLGNSLRRILLSSLPGAAITSVRIEGVLHEFSTMPYVKEDVTDIVLNLKDLLIKLNTDGPKTLRLIVENKSDEELEVTAGHIEETVDVDILNPDLKICTLEPASDGNIPSIVAEITVDGGRGYIQAEKNKKVDHSIGVIPVDSIFTPVQKVNYTVQNSRVGDITDYDKLILEVWTHGKTSPKEAVNSAATILRDQLKLFIADEGVEQDAADLVDSKDEEHQRVLETPIDELELSVRAYNCLKRANIASLGELTRKSEEDLMKVRNCGRKTLDELKKKLEEKGLSLRLTAE
ncbi:MAG TPA: DNA-directed RNA polymerase subunit alpha [Bacillota bacterium]|nr:MAG: DNA-directed RNA polymerase subunit alpha [Firmicutes bacterium ADurb.Bin153]HNV35033.1 DNA-directed RNA polymerase subunit alpha [Bacillota bacterium]